MTDFLTQIVEIAQNEEFSPDQRFELIQIAVKDEDLRRWNEQAVAAIRANAGAFKEIPGIESVKDKFVADAVAKAYPPSLNIDAALGKHLTKDRLADGTLRLGLASHLSSDE